RAVAGIDRRATRDGPPRRRRAARAPAPARRRELDRHVVAARRPPDARRRCGWNRKTFPAPLNATRVFSEHKEYNGGDSEGHMAKLVYCEHCGGSELAGTDHFLLFHHLSFCSADCRDDYRAMDDARRDTRHALAQLATVADVMRREGAAKP